MLKLNKKFNAQRQTVESMSSACYYTCTCSCSFPSCSCNTVSDYGGFQYVNYSDVATAAITASPSEFNNYLAQYAGIV